MKAPGGVLSGWLLGWASRLRFPQLFRLTLALFVLDLLIPDVVPFADEILLGLLTLLLGTLTKKPAARRPPGDPGTIEARPLPGRHPPEP